MTSSLSIPRLYARIARWAPKFGALALAAAVAACDVALAPGGPSGPRLDTSAPVPVALLVPGSAGDPGDAAVSRSLENAARLAIADLDGVAVDLTVYPTGGTASGAQGAAQQAAADGAAILLGPLYAEAANAAGLTVASQGLNVLAFSNNSAIAGGNVFILGNTFESIARRLTSYAARNGAGDLLVAHANTTAELAGRDAILNAANATRANVVGTVSFELTEAGIRGAAPQIASQVQATGADGIFFTSSNAGAMAFLPQFLGEQGIRPSTTQYIGLTRLDIPSEALSQPGLQGAWLALPDPGLVTNFRSRYNAAYGSAPHPLAGLAYDGIAAIGALAAQGRADALSRANLTTGSGFVGVNGIFRFNSDGTNDRGYAVGQIRNNQVAVIDPAPRRFGGAGF